MINGERETGVTAQYMAEALDAGDIIDTRKTAILPGETAGELFERLAPMGAELLVETLRHMENGTARRTPQIEAEATAEIGGERFKIFKAFNTEKNVSAAPGTVLSAGKAGIEIAVADGSVTVTQLQAPGGKRMAAADYLRGHPLCL